MESNAENLILGPVHPIQPGTITFNIPGHETPALLVIGADGFWVRGVQVEQDAEEAEVVYFALLEWLTGTTHSADVRLQLDKAKARRVEHGK